MQIASQRYQARQDYVWRARQFNQSMQLGEQYGIHPLNMLGHAGSMMGTGGGNVADLIDDERKSRRIRKQQIEDQEFYRDTARELKMMDIAAANIPWTRAKESEKTNNIADDWDAGKKYFSPVFDWDFEQAVRDAVNNVKKEWQDTKNYMQRFNLREDREYPPVPYTKPLRSK